MPGMTAYFGLLDVGQPKAGDDGRGLRRRGRGGLGGRADREDQGLPRGRHRRRRATSAATWSRSSASTPRIDYKAEDVKKALRTHCPNGIDVYFDNVGGDILDAALANLATQGAHRDLRRDLAVQQHRRA